MMTRAGLRLSARCRRLATAQADTQAACWRRVFFGRARRSLHASALASCCLAAVHCALLFFPDAVLPALVAGFPPAGAWLDQLLAAA